MLSLASHSSDNVNDELIVFLYFRFAIADARSWAKLSASIFRMALSVRFEATVRQPGPNGTRRRCYSQR